MTDQPSNQQPRKISKYLHEYRMKLSQLKIRSFYAYHLCKKNCLQGKLNSNPEPCFDACDTWLKGFFDTKKDRNPEQAQAVLYAVENRYEAIKNNQDLQYQRQYSQAKFDTDFYLNLLQEQIDNKIKLQTQKK